jgi:hypothetical protein
MEAIETLNLLKVEYTRFKEWGYPMDESAERAVKISLPKNKPHIYYNNNEYPSHIFFGGYVFFFEGCKIYKEIK